MDVLICDSDAAMRQVLKRLLVRAYGCDVFEASTGLEAVDVLTERHIDVLILDAHVPVMDGVEVCDALRHSSQFRDLPVMVLTLEGDESIITRLIRLGVDDIVLKPLQADRVMERFAGLAKRASTKRRPRSASAECSAELTIGSSVLIADGDGEYRDLFRKTLGDQFTISAAHTGADAVRRCLVPNPPSAVFIGNELGLIGPERLARKLRSALGRRVRLVGLAHKRNLESARQAEWFDDVMPQSFVAGTIKSEIQKLLRQTSALAQFQGFMPGLRSSLVAASEQVFGMMLHSEVEAIEGSLPVTDERVAFSTVDLEVSGFTVHFRFRFGFESGGHIAAAFLEAQPEDMVAEDIESVAGELANVISGRLHNAYIKRGAKSVQKLPAFGWVPADAVEPAINENTICLSFSAVDRPITFELRVQVESPQVAPIAGAESDGHLTAVRVEG